MTIPPQDYLRTLNSIRDRCYQVYEQAAKGALQYFDVDESKLPAVVDHVIALAHRRFPDMDAIPPHSRLRHFDHVYQTWREKTAKADDKIELARKLVDLVIVSVLVDAGAGPEWKYKTDNDKLVGRSEGLALASVDMFLSGSFSSTSVLDQVDAEGLANVSPKTMAQGFQVTESNPMVGLEGRSTLLNRLGNTLKSQPKYFPASGSCPTSRPGNLIDYILANKQDDGSISIDTLWEAVMSLGSIWPARVEVNGVQLGDVWPCPCLGSNMPDNIVPFHKLSQWLTYSLTEVIETALDMHVHGIDKLTGLPEYRNGGLFIDYGVFVIKPEQIERGGGNGSNILPTFEGHDPLIVEWRALTVVYLDKVHKELEAKLGRKLKLAQVLEGGTWTAGREIAATLRPDNAGPPIIIKSDGTLF
ncbi:hypothetical protein O0I10_007647 [Lichtheimia ornata]|uniref:Duf1688-domain-containing protein n=1 Tax=Lichtheimia ornata TaxID=688661 RepID=A0AAD7XW14_9FUNG|nr:uncharacterized protein O0I10_007647 [Lichtheimia ornata]KAJ8656570.1 hypothetical protein O0I10_007647 [Lichtheimia ornata]